MNGEEKLAGVDAATTPMHGGLEIDAVKLEAYLRENMPPWVRRILCAGQAVGRCRWQA